MNFNAHCRPLEVDGSNIKVFAVSKLIKRDYCQISWMGFTLCVCVFFVQHMLGVVVVSCCDGRKEGNVLFNDTLNTFYLRLYGIAHMVKDL